jgi:hypothetical protein
MSVFPSKVNYTTGEVLTATEMNEIGQAINLLDGAQFAAGKNKIINGDFGINQRGFTSNTTSLTYNFDRWLQANGGTSGTLTVTPQTFTAGAAPVAGYEGKNFLQGVTAAGANTDTFAFMVQRIEDVRTLAGQTTTFSFWAKASSGTPKIALELGQNFGTGGSPSASVLTTVSAVTISTSWVRYSITTTVPSLSGKTIGTTANTSYLIMNLWLSAGSDFNARASSIGLQNNTFQIWGVQAEAANTASPFQTATGTIQGELAACQRYYFRFAGGQTFSRYGTGYSSNTNTAFFNLPLPVSLRVSPTAVDYSTLILDNGFGTSAAVTAVTLTSNCQSPTVGSIGVNVASGLTADRNYQIENNGSTAGFIGFTAEL